jgi:hypothetical protein
MIILISLTSEYALVQDIPLALMDDEEFAYLGCKPTIDSLCSTLS